MPASPPICCPIGRAGRRPVRRQIRQRARAGPRSQPCKPLSWPAILRCSAPVRRRHLPRCARGPSCRPRWLRPASGWRCSAPVSRPGTTIRHLCRVTGLPPAGLALRIIESARLWDICALIATSRACIASSLHARIVATAFARPRLSLVPPGGSGQSRKLLTYLECWEPSGPSACRACRACCRAVACARGGCRRAKAAGARSGCGLPGRP